MKILFIILFIAGLFFLVVWLQGLNRKRVAKALANAVRQFGLTHEALEDEFFDEIWESYMGNIKGVSVKMIGGGFLAGRNPGMVASGNPGIAGAILPTILIRASIPKPFPFAIKITQLGTLMKSSVVTGDTVFDKACYVETADTEKAALVLRQIALRDGIRKLIKQYAVNAAIFDGEIVVKVANFKATANLVRETAALALTISKLNT